jgi:DNA-binding HxlR family transcriptional regulator
MSTDETALVALEEYRCCPVTRLLHRLGDTWSPAVIRVLAEGGRGFNELDRAIEGVSRRMLTRTLRSLEEAGVVSRSARPEAGTRVEYALTPLGFSVRAQLYSLSRLTQ